MHNPKKLLTENFNTSDTKFLTEDFNGEKFMYIHGVFLGAEKRNRNNRLYRKSLIEREVESFQSLIKTNEAMGELNHPENSEINPDRGAILITELKMDGNNAVGRARVLPTPCGNILAGLVRGGVKMGVSSRGVGSTDENNNVCEDFQLITIDAVYMPSCDDAYVNAVNESVEWVLDSKTNLLIEKKVRVDDAGSRFKYRLDNGGSSEIASAFVEYLETLKSL